MSYSDDLRARMHALLAHGVSMRRICLAAGIIHDGQHAKIAAWLRGEDRTITIETADRLLDACRTIDETLDR
jgi:hypothetical protein